MGNSVGPRCPQALSSPRCVCILIVIAHIRRLVILITLLVHLGIFVRGCVCSCVCQVILISVCMVIRKGLVIITHTSMLGVGVHVTGFILGTPNVQTLPACMTLVLHAQYLTIYHMN